MFLELTHQVRRDAARSAFVVEEERAAVGDKDTDAPPLQYLVEIAHELVLSGLGDIKLMHLGGFAGRLGADDASGQKRYDHCYHARRCSEHRPSHACNPPADRHGE